MTLPPLNNPNKLINSGLKSGFQAQDFTKTLPIHYTVLWDSAQVGIHEGLGRVVEIPVEHTPLPTGHATTPTTYKLIAFKNKTTESKYDYYVGRFLHRNKKQPVSLFNLNAFSGFLKIRQPNGKIVHTKYYNKGVFLSTQKLSNEEYLAIKNQSNFAQPRCLVETTYHYTDYYDGQTGEYLGSYLNNITRRYICFNSGGSGGGDDNDHTSGGGGYGGPGSGSSGPSGSNYIERTEEKLNIGENMNLFLINTSELNNPCVEGILKKLQTKDAHHMLTPDIKEADHLSKMILDLFDASRSYHLKFLIGDATGDNGEIANAKTDPIPMYPTPGQFTFEITLDDNFVQNATQLAIARTLIHESVHAYLGYIYQDAPFSSLSDLLKKYAEEYGQGGEYDYNMAQHEIMAQYAEALGYSLAAWDDHALPNKYYHALAYSGDMLKSKAFDKLNPSFQNLVLDANLAEGNTISKANNQAKGTKNCNEK